MPTGVSLSDAGNYDVVVNNITNLPVTSNAAVLTVSSTPLAPGIETAPQSQTVALGGTVTFSVTANGTTPFTYQWRRNGGNLANGGGVGDSSACAAAVLCAWIWSLHTPSASRLSGLATS